MTKKDEIIIKPTTKQKKALKLLLDDHTTEVLFGGGAGSGKSFLGCLWITSICLKYTGIRCLIGRAQLKTLKETTLKTLFEVFPILGLQNEVHYTYNASNNTIKFINGSEILLKDLEQYPSDPNFDSLGSLEITAAFIDEANQLTEKAKMIVMSRIRYKLDEYKLIPKILMTCNPAKGWVYEEYYLKNRNNGLEEYKAFIQALVTDNKHISKHYISNLQKLDEISKKRLLYGEWEYSSDLGLFNYDRLISAFKNIDNPSTNITHITVDVARLGKDSTVIYLWDGLSIIKTIVFHKKTTDIVAAKLKELVDEYKIKAHQIIIDADGIGGGLIDQIKGSRSFINNSKPLNGDNYQNLKTQCYYKLAELINLGKIEVYSWDNLLKTELIKELSIVEAKNVDKDGKKQITSKDDIKRLIGKSPDYSDAMMLRMLDEIKPSGNFKSFKISGINL